MGGDGAGPGRLVPVLALLSWAAGLGVAEETPSRFPAGEVLTPPSTSASGGNRATSLSSLHAPSLRDPNRGAPRFAVDGHILSSAPESSSPSSLCLLATPRLGLGCAQTLCAPTHSFFLGRGVRLPRALALAGVRKLSESW